MNRKVPAGGPRRPRILKAEPGARESDEPAGAEQNPRDLPASLRTTSRTESMSSAPLTTLAILANLG